MGATAAATLRGHPAGRRRPHSLSAGVGPAHVFELLAVSDVLLDPIHFGGGNTTYEGLAVDTPIVTLPSNFLRGRITFAFYKQMNMLDCVVENRQDYVKLALRLGTDSDYRDAIRTRSLSPTACYLRIVKGFESWNSFSGALLSPNLRVSSVPSRVGRWQRSPVLPTCGLALSSDFFAGSLHCCMIARTLTGLHCSAMHATRCNAVQCMQRGATMQRRG